MARAALAALVLAFALAIASASGCGGGDDEPASSPPRKPAPAPAPAAEPAPEPTPEPESAALDPGDAKLGAEVYAANCATCHGTTGDGDGPLSASLDPKPARHSDGGYMNTLDDAYLVSVIREGGAAVGKSALMAPWGAILGDADIANVIAFIRSIADPPYQPPASK